MDTGEKKGVVVVVFVVVFVVVVVVVITVIFLTEIETGKMGTSENRDVER